MATAYHSLLEQELRRADARSIITIVRLVVADAYLRRASDVHIDPTPNTTDIRLRIDGYLSKPYSLPKECHAELIARLKILARLRIDEHFSPQDGRFTFVIPDGGTTFDVRISILPSHHGESAVLRLLIPHENPDSLGTLGMRLEQEQELDRALAQPHGMIVVVGPTGSGKTTTLYALIRRLFDKGRSIVSIEDPIEYSLPEIRQVQVMPKHGLTFVDSLRALLRQDPDVIVNPLRQFAQARNTKRVSDISAILNAVSNRIADNNGQFTGGTCDHALPTETMNISDTGEGVDLRPCLVPDYIPELPVDPIVGKNECTSDSCAGHSYTTGYTVGVTDSHRVTVCAPQSMADGMAKQYCLTR